MNDNGKEEKKDRHLMGRFGKGCLKILLLKWQTVIPVIVLALSLCLADWLVNAVPQIPHIEELSEALRFVVERLPFALPVIVTVASVIAIGTPIGYSEVPDAMKRAGMINRIGETPYLLDRYRDRDAIGIDMWKFAGVGIPLSVWEEAKEYIEAVLNIRIVRIEEGRDKRVILVYAVSARTKLPRRIEWHDLYLFPDSSTFVLGKSLLGDVTVNLAEIPHVLLGGSTGSGKSVLLKLMLMQAIRKGMDVNIADFKGGVDYQGAWERACRVILTPDELIPVLGEIVAELKRRKDLFKEHGVTNIDEYNNLGGEQLRRVIFACDEVAELLDKSGTKKERKDMIAEIEHRISTVARMGRAFGVHLFLATQRPDAGILNGQIKNNISFAVCGRADRTLSDIILGRSDVPTAIPDNVAGRFMTRDGTVFQAYKFDPNQL